MLIRGGLAWLLFAVAHAAQQHAQQRRAFLQLMTKGRFETLEECEKAYEELLAKTQVTTEPDYQETPAPTPAPTAATTTTTTTTTLPPLKKSEVGQLQPAQDARPAYHPPVGGSGKPSESEGWDYEDHGASWPKTAGGESCGGTGQSPIDIIKYVDLGGQTKSVLWFDYYSDVEAGTVAQLHNDGHSVFYDEDLKIDIGDVKIGTTVYKAFKYEFHAPSEHTIDGQVYPLEIQILHKDAAGKMLGVSVLFKYGASNKYLSALKDAIPEMPTWNVEHGKGLASVTGKHPDFFNLEEILPDGEVHPGGDMTFYNYEGSLTAPPCTGGVDWWVTAEAVTATRDEIKHVRTAILGSESMKHGNNREVQDLAGRKVYVGHTGFQHHVKHYGHLADEPPSSRGYNTQDGPWA
jgi:carbonic anhydrase